MRNLNELEAELLSELFVGISLSKVNISALARLLSFEGFDVYFEEAYLRTAYDLRPAIRLPKIRRMVTDGVEFPVPVRVRTSAYDTEGEECLGYVTLRLDISNFIPGHDEPEQEHVECLTNILRCETLVDFNYFYIVAMDRAKDEWDSGRVLVNTLPGRIEFTGYAIDPSGMKPLTSCSLSYFLWVEHE